MSQITLKASEIKFLLDAAANGGRIVFPDRMKETTRQRMAGLFAKHALTEAGGDDGELRLSRAGYRAVGLRPPRKAEATAGAEGAHVSKRDLVRELLAREEGASLDELVGATGWLPHTTRAALSRVRSGGQALAKFKREDGTTCYRILPPPPAAASRKERACGPEATAEITA